MNNSKHHIILLILWACTILDVNSAGNEMLTVHVRNTANEKIGTARVFVSSMGNKIYAKYNSGKGGYYFDSIPPGYNTVEVFADGYIPAGIRIGDSSQVTFTLKKIFEQRLIGTTGSRFYGYSIGRDKDTFFQRIGGVIFISKEKGFSKDDMAYYRQIGLNEDKQLVGFIDPTRLKFFRMKSGRDFERYNCPELSKIRLRDPGCLAGVPIYVSKAARKLRAYRNLSIENVFLISNKFYSGGYADLYALFRENIPRGYDSASWSIRQKRFEADSVYLNRFGITRSFLSPDVYKGTSEDFTVSPVCEVTDHSIGEGMLDMLLNAETSKVLMIQMPLPDIYHYYHKKSLLPD
jgi:hypothetical protein